MSNAFRYKPGTIVNSLRTSVTVSNSEKSLEVIALWDTGATLCCVSEDVINKLNLIPTGQIRVNTPSSSGELVNTYVVNLLLPNEILIRDVVVASSKIGAQGIGLLIGMDIISRGDFLISNNKETVFSFKIPSEMTTDLVAGVNFRNLMGPPHGKGKRKR